MKTFTIVRAQHAGLHQRFDLAAGGFVEVGDRQGTYGREDSATGAEYRCLALGPGKRGKVAHSSDFKPGLFYPENIFIWGSDDDDEPILHEDVEAFCKASRLSSTKRVLLPNGWRHGRLTWYNAVMSSPVENKPDWYSLPVRLAQAWPAGEIVNIRAELIEIVIP